MGTSHNRRLSIDGEAEFSGCDGSRMMNYGGRANGDPDERSPILEEVSRTGVGRRWPEGAIPGPGGEAFRMQQVDVETFFFEECGETGAGGVR